jgi:hypothetical protein
MKDLLLRGKDWMTVALAAALALLSACGGKEQSSEAAGKIVADQLQKSFHKAEGAIKEQTAEAVAAVLEKDYVRAVSTMNQVIRKERTLDAVQRKALDDLLRHARKATEREPQLNSPQLYKATVELQLLLHPIE